jgi:hypothetical protein
MDQSEMSERASDVQPRRQIHVRAENIVSEPEQVRRMHDALSPIEAHPLGDLS